MALRRPKLMDKRTYAVKQGYACRCEQCEGEREGVDLLFSAQKWCPGCGHGYLHVGSDLEGGGCSKCGQWGGWLSSKPVLPFMPKVDAIDRVLAESRAVVARLLEVYNPEYVKRVCETDYFSLPSIDIESALHLGPPVGQTCQCGLLPWTAEDSQRGWTKAAEARS